MNDVISLLERNTAASELLQDSAFTYAKSQALSDEQWKRIGLEYYNFSLRFPRILAALIPRIPDSFAQFELNKLLSDEEGGDGGRPHIELFVDFLNEVIVGRPICETPGKLETTESLLVWLQETYANAPLAYAVGAQYAFEAIGEFIIKGFIEILRNETKLTARGRRYFDVHSVEEPLHVALMERCLDASVQNEQDTNLAVQGANESSRRLKEFWNGIWSLALPNLDVLKYYEEIDAGRIDDALCRFASDAIYRRTGFDPFKGKDQIENFFKNIRKLRGKHHIFSCDDQKYPDRREVFVKGKFVGTHMGFSSEMPVEIPYDDHWIYNLEGQVTYRQSTLERPSSPFSA